MHLRRALLITAAIVLPARALGQQPVGEYQAAPRYSTFNLALQLTGDPARGRELMLSWGRMRTLGGGAWMPWVEIAAGVSPGNREVVEGMAAGPRVTLARAFPSQFVEFGRGSRAEPYLVASAAMYMAGDFSGGTRWGGAPAVSGGFGFRIFQDRWKVDLSTLELLAERRFGVQGGPARLYIRLGRAVALRDHAREPGPSLTGQSAAPLPSPESP
jgi:hypothetical protein